MRALLGAVLLCLVGSLLVGGPADAARSQQRARVVLDRPVEGEGVVRLSGRAPGRRSVVLQTRSHGAWHDMRTVRVRHGRYATKVAVRAQRQVFRTRAGRAHSRARVIAPRVAADGCGARPRKADGTYWSCTFVDDFSGARLDRTKWIPQTAWATGDALSGYACYDDDPSVVSVGGGTLNLSVRKDDAASACGNGLPDTPYRAGSVSTWHLFSQRYGRFEARFRTTESGQGLQEAFWLWPDDRDPAAQLPWPLNGEIDIAETYSVHPDLAIPFLHYTSDDNGGPIDGTNTAWDCKARRGVYNTYALEWSESRLELFVNGRSCLVNTSGNAAFRKKYIVNLTQALGTAGNTLGARTSVPATMNVDYVRVWK